MKRLLICAAALVSAAPVQARDVKIVHNSAALEFNYSWPIEAAAIPSLDRRFRAEATQQYRRHLALAREDKKLYIEQQRGSVSDYYSKKWSSAGETKRLLSLQYQHSTYTGGAHPNTDYGALLWDRKLNHEIAVSRLFLRSVSFEKLTRSDYCTGLNNERQKRREGWRPGLPDFNACPPYRDLAISPLDKNRSGRFDTIQFVASPYTAGPYAEGVYAVDLPITRALIAAMKPEYRSSFEAQRQ